MNSIKKIKIAFVHDDFIQFGGAEKLFLEIIKEFQNDSRFELTIYTSIVSPEWKSVFKSLDLKYHDSFLGLLPFSHLYSKLFFINGFFYYAFESFDFSGFDFVVSSSTRFGHFLITKPSTYHISYINSPSRALWDERSYFFKKKLFYFLIKNLLPTKRIYDFYSQSISDLVITNSYNIQKKFKKVYGRKSLILFPFVVLKEIPNEETIINGKYFLLVSRLASWKRIDYVIDAFNKNNLKLIIVGDGEEKVRYKKIANNNIIFKGYVTDSEKNILLKNAEALIFPQVEDFGMTILEALYFQIPVIYLNKGGAKEILNKKVGVGFETQTEKDLSNAILRFEDFKFDVKEANNILKRYSKENFVNFLKKLVLTAKKQ